MKWQEYIRKNIFVPSGMNTSTITDGPHPQAGVSHAYIKKGNKFEELDYGEEPTFAAAGNGGVWSTVEELWLLEQAIQKQKFLSAEWINRSRTVYPMTKWIDKTPSLLGLSWFITRELNAEMIGHTGSQGGFITDYVWIPEKKIFYILLCNIPKPIQEIRQKILDLVDR
jgi:CubicO group peptidase (beta-lactamase class C family)